MATQIANQQEHGILIVGASNAPDSYVLWQRDMEGDDEDGIHFEYDDQVNGVYENVSGLTITREGIQVAMNGGQMVHFSFDNIALKDYHRLQDGLRQIYAEQPHLVSVVDT